MGEGDIRMTFSKLHDGISPEPGAAQDVGFVYRTDTPVTQCSRLKRFFSDPNHFRPVIAHGVVGKRILSFQIGDTWLTKVDAAGQLPDNENIHTTDHLFFQ